MDIKEQCMRLYTETFRDDDTVFAERLFDLYFDDCRYTIKDGRAVSMLFALPCTVILGEKSYSARYIYAAATDDRYRSRGLMNTLIGNLKRNGELLFLKPANDALIEFYRHMGFICFDALRTESGINRVIVPEAFRKLAVGCEQSGSRYTAMYFYGESLTIDNLGFPFTME